MKKNVIRLISQVHLFGLFLLIMACQTIAKQEYKPAIISQPSKEATAELTNAISQLLNGTPVTLAETAFTKLDRIGIVRKDFKSIDQNNLNGRIMEKPIIFTLVKNSQGCFVIKQGTQEKRRLFKSRCTTLSN